MLPKRRLLLIVSTLLYMQALAQSGMVKGRVLTDEGTVIPGASVRIKNTNQPVMASDEGQFSIEVFEKSILVVTAMGYETKEITAEGGQTLDVRLSRTTQTMGEVVVTALGVRREKRALTYSTQELRGEQLVATKESNLVNA